jgi:hypothetical protein
MTYDLFVIRFHMIRLMALICGGQLSFKISMASPVIAHSKNVTSEIN